MSPFLVLALPRSRTAWLARFLTYGDWACGHEELRHMRSLDDVRAWFSQPCTGTIETAAAPFWRLLGADVRLAVIRRPVSQVVDSLMALPVAYDRARLEAIMLRQNRKLDQIEARIPGVLSLRFEDLQDEETCARLFEHCLPYRHDSAHWAAWAPVNVQCNMPAMMRYFQAYRPALDKLALVARHHMLGRLALREPVAPDGMILQTETFDTWLADAGPLFDEHLVQVGEAPGDWRNKNIPLMRRIYDVGAMQIMTARCNGRMFGYLMTLIAPSLTSETVTSATHTTFFASPDAAGLGLKLHRAAILALRERGVDDVFMRAGVRGSGNRLDTIYRRLGAEDNGQEFRLVLEGV